MTPLVLYLVTHGLALAAGVAVTLASRRSGSAVPGQPAVPVALPVLQPMPLPPLPGLPPLGGAIGPLAQILLAKLVERMEARAHQALDHVTDKAVAHLAAVPHPDQAAPTQPAPPAPK